MSNTLDKPPFHVKTSDAVRRMTRSTNAFSKKMENHAHAPERLCKVADMVKVLKAREQAAN